MEILAPAGNLEILKAVIQAGCDAVYISGKNYGARKFAGNFTNEELEEAVKYAHLRNKLVYVTVNTIIYDNEFADLDSYLNFLSIIKVDAVIVQDLGVIHFIRKNYPTIIVHASTQLNIHNVDGAKKLLELGVKRVVLARETPINVVKEIIETGIEVEVFSHGALCYSYSGQCLMSYSIGGRSGNRGECAQPCRKKYTLIENNEILSNACSLLSMKDLNTLDEINYLKDLGVSSIKIEGRMKSISYVTTVTKIYKNHLNNIFNKDDDKNLKLVFNREFVKGYLFNQKNHEMTNLSSVNHQGILIGKVKSVNQYGIELILNENIEINDGIRIKGKNEIGFYVNNYKKNDNIYFIDGKFNVSKNDLVYKTVSNFLNNESNKYLINENYNISLNANLEISVSKQLILKLSGLNTTIICYGDLISEIANKALNLDRIKEQIKKTDSSLISIDNIDINYDNLAFVKISEINSLRRNAINMWVNSYLNNYVLQKNDPYLFDKTININNTNENIIFDFIVHTKEQYDWCIKNGYNNVYDYYNNSIKKYHRHFHLDSISINDSIVHNFGDFKDSAILSISCNIVNSQTLELLNKYNLNGVYLSNELNDNQIFELGKNKLNYQLGVMVYGANLMLVSKHCFISKLKNINKTNCNSCLKNRYYILDDYNNKMPVFSRCSLEPELIIYNYKKKNNIKNIKEYIKNNITRFLFVFTDESIEDLEQLKNTIDKIRG